VHAGLVVHRAEEGLEQAGEGARLGPGVPVAAVRAGDAVDAALGRAALLLLELLTRWSSRKRLWQLVHSTSGSENTSTWPEASHTLRGRMTEESRPTTSSRLVTMNRHHCFLMFSFSSTPRGP